jgi:hypothetical protein
LFNSFAKQRAAHVEMMPRRLLGHARIQPDRSRLLLLMIRPARPGRGAVRHVQRHHRLYQHHFRS